jgi:hypothetical protein
MSRLAHRGRPDERGRAPYADYAPSAPEPFRHASYDDGAVVPARHRGLDWPEPEPARAHDPYHGTEAYRQPRDEYPAEAWPHAQGRYPAAGREWREGTYVKAAYPDGAWPAASSSSSNHYEPRGYDERPPDDFRGGRADARGYGHDRDAYAQHRDEQRDSGWASRKRGSDRNHGARQWGGEPRNDAGPPSALPSAEDRSWQPAPSWQATRRGNDTQNSRYQGGRGGNMNAYPNQKKSGKKKKNKNNRPPQGREHDEEGGAVNKCVTPLVHCLVHAHPYLAAGSAPTPATTALVLNIGAKAATRARALARSLLTLLAALPVADRAQARALLAAANGARAAGVRTKADPKRTVHAHGGRLPGLARLGGGADVGGAYLRAAAGVEAGAAR